MTEGENTVRATEVRKENTVRATEGMEKIAENAMVKNVATSYCETPCFGQGRGRSTSTHCNT